MIWTIKYAVLPCSPRPPSPLVINYYSRDNFWKDFISWLLPESRRWKDFSLHSIKIIVTFLFMCLKITFDDDDGGGNDCLASEGECIEGSTVMIINVHSVILHVSNYFQ